MSLGMSVMQTNMKATFMHDKMYNAKSWVRQQQPKLSNRVFCPIITGWLSVFVLPSKYPCFSDRNTAFSTQTPLRVLCKTVGNDNACVFADVTLDLQARPKNELMTMLNIGLTFGVITLQILCLRRTE